jgi:hypothetical protein
MHWVFDIMHAVAVHDARLILHRQGVCVSFSKNVDDNVTTRQLSVSVDMQRHLAKKLAEHLDRYVIIIIRPLQFVPHPKINAHEGGGGVCAQNNTACDTLEFCSGSKNDFALVF